MPLLLMCREHPCYTGHCRPVFNACQTCWELHRVATSARVANLLPKAEQTIVIIDDPEPPKWELDYLTVPELIEKRAPTTHKCSRCRTPISSTGGFGHCPMCATPFTKADRVSPPVPNKPAQPVHPSSVRRQRLYGLLPEQKPHPPQPQPPRPSPPRKRSRRKRARP